MVEISKKMGNCFSSFPLRDLRVFVTLYSLSRTQTLQLHGVKGVGFGLWSHRPTPGQGEDICPHITQLSLLDFPSRNALCLSCSHSPGSTRPYWWRLVTVSSSLSLSSLEAISPSGPHSSLIIQGNWGRPDKMFSLPRRLLGELPTGAETWVHTLPTAAGTLLTNTHESTDLKRN